MQAVILAAGRGRRMEPLSATCHKALLEIGGSTILGRALDSLLTNAEGRRQMGVAGRHHAVENYGLEAQADKLAAALREAAS